MSISMVGRIVAAAMLIAGAVVLYNATVGGFELVLTDAAQYFAERAPVTGIGAATLALGVAVVRSVIGALDGGRSRALPDLVGIVVIIGLAIVVALLYGVSMFAVIGALLVVSAGLVQDLSATRSGKASLPIPSSHTMPG